MNRRGFLKKIPLMAGASFVINGLPVGLLQAAHLTKAAADATSDRVLVLIQLHGGNDGLNMVIPVDAYAGYRHLRPNIAIADHGSRRYIPLDNTLNIIDQVGLHPDMMGLKELYDNGKAAIVQGVSYDNLNGSHFRSRDIWFMGGNYDEYLSSGWMGRYLGHQHPGYPENFPSEENPDPLALEIGSTVSLAFHQNNGIPLAVAMDNPEEFYDLVKKFKWLPPESITNTYYGKELKWILDIDNKSDQYADRLKEAFEKGSNSASATYPQKYPFNAPKNSLNNHLTPQLKLVARLLSGGCRTKVFLVKLGGFDTHAEQVEKTDPSMGSHAALLYHLSSALKAFQDDLRGLGLEDRVLTVTFSEFGRRAASNGSYGTDHGSGAPMLVVGKQVRGGVVGTNPDLQNLDKGNIPMQHDYRQVFTTVLQDWLGATDSALESTRFQDFRTKKLPLIKDSLLGNDTNFSNSRYKLNDCYPNPVKSTTTFSYYVNDAVHVKLSIINMDGKRIKTLVDERKKAGSHQCTVNLSGLGPSTYLYNLQAGSLDVSKKVIVVP